MLKRGNKAWIKIQGKWLVLNPQTEQKKTKDELLIEKYEKRISELKKSKQLSKTPKRRWSRRSPEEIKAHMEKMREARAKKQQLDFENI